MRYKIGDKVTIRSWDDLSQDKEITRVQDKYSILKDKYALQHSEGHVLFTMEMEKLLPSNRIVTIRDIVSIFPDHIRVFVYKVSFKDDKEEGYNYEDWMIEESQEEDRIVSRFDLLDFDN